MKNKFFSVAALTAGYLLFSLSVGCADERALNDGAEPQPSEGQVIFAAPDGKSTGSGTIDSPLDIFTAVARIEPGGTIYMRGGKYMLHKDVILKKAGSESKPLNLWAYKDEKPEFDCSEQTHNNVGLHLTTGQWWHIKGLSVCNAYKAGVKIRDASHNTFERCTSHHNGGTGFYIGYPHVEENNPDGEKAAYNTFINCDAHHNFDWWTKDRPGTNTDGFACQSNTGKGNRFIGCRAWANSDDAWDFFECGFGIELIDCWAWSTGMMEDHKEMYRQHTGKELTEELFDGNGNGFKMGGGCLFIAGRECRFESRGTHVLRGCVAFNNASNGIDQNHHAYGAVIENCMAFYNKRNYNFNHPNKNKTEFVLRNCLSWGAPVKDRFENADMVYDNNLWQLPGLTDDPAAEFVSLTPESAEAPRKSDGGLPDEFARLKKGSVLIDKGVPTQKINLGSDVIHLDPIPYKGKRPDLAPIELK
ncbi:right-handed parallel beta-helix repeat-containing protein [Gallalistipes aquisgranensis]|uniref:right-handed parallel beta-helix repeat-containing protein n=1 Tax=Gallalistipes aquisgranensis TaxID=2779358 RepID=UPI001CF82500|nr:right-handed parallel beta-helix repeat-containing protein [Gallalistipes aquisgranensis]MBE5034427.1 right-handed parallel beta-helix repeat-containing protein [Gallalistipes aquisgranensis]